MAIPLRACFQISNHLALIASLLGNWAVSDARFFKIG